jgi:hypothetical protein
LRRARIFPLGAEPAVAYFRFRSHRRNEYPTMKILLSTLLVLAAVSTAPALTIEGVTVPAQKTVAGETLSLNGAGVRTVKLAFIPVKAYVASFYAPTALRSSADVTASPGPLQFNFTFLQSVNQGQVTDAWNAQFKASVTAPYPGLAADQAKFVGFFGPLKKGGVETVELVGTNTLVYDGGTLKGTIPGRDFQKAFLSLWFGSQPVQASLKDALLGGGQ